MKEPIVIVPAAVIIAVILFSLRASRNDGGREHVYGTWEGCCPMCGSQMERWASALTIPLGLPALKNRALVETLCQAYALEKLSKVCRKGKAREKKNG
jgi:hypothetical protein